MSKKKPIILIILATFLIAGIIFLMSRCSPKNLVHWMFSAQYNEKGISHFLVITIDENQPKEYIGKVEDHNIYVEKLNIGETNFRSVDAKNVSIKDAVENDLVSIEDWKKHARTIKMDGDTEILRYENYEIAVSSEECIIRPITK